ncbi:Calmodulin-2 [Bienertia sinuspersici]
MDPPPTSFSGRRRSSVIDPNTPLPTTSASPTPRKASTWDSPTSSTTASTASDISSRRASESVEAPASGYPTPDAQSIATRKASAWDNDNDNNVMRSTRASVSEIAQRRATALDRPPWDAFAGEPPGYEDSTWRWMSEIVNMTSGTSPVPPSCNGPTSERNRVFYGGSINYIFENYNDQNLAVTDVEAIMYAYGVTNAEVILNRIDPQKSGTININSQNNQILVDSAINFSPPNEPLTNLRHASKCFQQNLLSPIHFAAYIIDVVKGRYLGNEPRFMILGIYSILGVLEGSKNRELTTKDVETFARLWKVNHSDEAQDLIDMIEDDQNGTISCWELYNLLYRRNVFGKQRIQMFDTLGQQNMSMFFPLMDKDEDGFLSSADLCSFASIFGRYPSDESIDRVTSKLDMDGDSKISLEDFSRAMAPVFDGITWEFWLVAILVTLEL